MSDALFRPHSSSPLELQERLAADRRGEPYLLLRDDEGRQRLIPLDDQRLTIGRSPEADVALTWDPEVSRFHAVLERTVDGWSIVDDGRALNGTFVNRVKIRGRKRLRDRDVVQVGATACAFRDPSHRASEATLPALSRVEPVRVSEAQRRVLVALCRPFGEGRRFAAASTNQEIAEELVLSLDAVKTHLRTLVQVFGLDGLPRAQKRTSLVECAFLTGVVSDADYETR